MVLGAAVAHSGLLKRLTLLVMKAFPGTYLGQLLGITISGVVISPLIPSGTARLALVRWQRRLGMRWGWRIRQNLWQDYLLLCIPALIVPAMCF